MIPGFVAEIDNTGAGVVGQALPVPYVAEYLEGPAGYVSGTAIAPNGSFVGGLFGETDVEFGVSLTPADRIVLVARITQLGVFGAAVLDSLTPGSLFESCGLAPATPWSACSDVVPV